MIDANHVSEIFMDCLFRKLPDDDTTCIMVYTVLGQFGFDPKKVKEHTSEITRMLKELPKEFWETTGGGFSFMRLPFTEKGEQWGEQKNGDELMALGLATGLMQYVFSKNMWTALPGRVPYVIIHENPCDIMPITIKDAKSGKFSISALIDVDK